MAITKVDVELDGKLITIEHGHVAMQANGSVVISCGDTMVLATACMSSKPRKDMSFFPLLCDYEERKYAVGKIPGGFSKRGGRPSEKAVLTSRLIDRPIRPLFDEYMRNDVQLIAMPLSMEPENPADMLAVFGASTALAISDIPWDGPIGCVRVCRVDGEFVINPSLDQIIASDMELIVAGKNHKVLEIELEAKQTPEDVVIEAIDIALTACDKLVDAQLELIGRIGKAKVAVHREAVDKDLLVELGAKVNDKIIATLNNPEASEKDSSIFQLRDELTAFLAPDYPGRESELGNAVWVLIKKQVRKMILEDSRRPDGRAMDQIRPLKCEVGILPRVHGSGLFSRGETQVLTALILGSMDESQIIDTLEEDTKKRFLHFYNFPPYSTGEVSPIRGAGRREVGHGSLAEKALRPVVPTDVDFPYTILLTSEVLGSNGSTSMASTCGCTLALMDAGVKIEEPVAGISIGLVTDGTKKVLFTDIQALEDFTGDMDFKVTGTCNGITAIQVDTKVDGLDMEIVSQAIKMARTGRIEILEVIAAAIPAPREELSQYAPRVLMVQIEPERIGEVIGPGGRVIKKIEAETGAKLSIEQDGRVYITCSDADGAVRAQKIVENLTHEIKVGEVFTGKVTRTEAFGAFVEIMPGKDGLVHISQLSDQRVNATEDVCKIGDELTVKVIEVGDDGKVRLTTRLDMDISQIPPRSSGGRSGGGRPSGPPRDRDRGGFSPRRDDDGPGARFRPKG